MDRPYYKKLDGLRALAVFGVMISHWIHFDFIQTCGFGFWGVNLFFVLSGFLITELLLRQIYQKEESASILKKFYIKRTLRIFPIYYLVIIFAFILNLDNSRNLALFSFLYTLNIYNSFSGNVGDALSHIWSLCVEEQFYLIWPLLLLLIKPRYHQKLIIAAVLFAILFRLTLYLLHVNHFEIYSYRMMPACMDALGLGALLAYLKLNKEDQLKKILNISAIPIILCSLYLFLVFFERQENIFSEILLRFLVSGCSFFIIGRSLYSSKKRLVLLFENKTVQYLGKISYGLYLYHMIVSALLNGWFSKIWNGINFNKFGVLKYNSYLVSFPLFLVITVLVASLSYYFIESPFLNIKEKLEHKWKRKSISQSSAAAVYHNAMQDI